MARARTLSFALAAIGLIAVAAPASAAEGVTEVKTQVKIRSVSPLGGREFFVWGTVHSSDEECERERFVKLIGGQRLRLRELGRTGGPRPG
jgi:hypothetical protein